MSSHKRFTEHEFKSNSDVRALLSGPGASIFAVECDHLAWFVYPGGIAASIKRVCVMEINLMSLDELFAVILVDYFSAFHTRRSLGVIGLFEESL